MQLARIYQFDLDNIDHTALFAASFSGWIMPAVRRTGISIALEGGLGSGKTTFVSFVAAALHSVDHVSSPSYVLQQQYGTPSDIIIDHWDLYRLPSGSLPEELYEPVCVNEMRIIEWASRAEQLQTVLDLSLTFKQISEECRSCTVSILKDSLISFLGEFSWYKNQNSRT